jgi:hypothetical protein
LRDTNGLRHFYRTSEDESYRFREIWPSAGLWANQDPAPAFAKRKQRASLVEPVSSPSPVVVECAMVFPVETQRLMDQDHWQRRKPLSDRLGGIALSVERNRVEQTDAITGKSDLAIAIIQEIRTIHVVAQNPGYSGSPGHQEFSYHAKGAAGIARSIIKSSLLRFSCAGARQERAQRFNTS